MSNKNEIEIVPCLIDESYAKCIAKGIKELKAAHEFGFWEGFNAGQKSCKEDYEL